MRRSSKVKLSSNFPNEFGANGHTELQAQYTNYKNTLQKIAQQIGDIEQDSDEHKYGVSFVLGGFFISNESFLLSKSI